MSALVPVASKMMITVCEFVGLALNSACSTDRLSIILDLKVLFEHRAVQATIPKGTRSLCVSGATITEK